MNVNLRIIRFTKKCKVYRCGQTYAPAFLNIAATGKPRDSSDESPASSEQGGSEMETQLKELRLYVAMLRCSVSEIRRMFDDAHEVS